MSHAQLKLLYVLVRLAEACVASKLGCGVDGFEGEQVERNERNENCRSQQQKFTFGIEFLRLRTYGSLLQQ